MTDTEPTLDARIDAVERAYEFMLGYAAQGREGDEQDGGDAEIRAYLEAAAAALNGIGTVMRETLAAEVDDFDAYAAFVEIAAADADKARAAIRLVLARAAIGSQLVDNLNAASHVRALLTDLFLIDEARRSPRG